MGFYPQELSTGVKVCVPCPGIASGQLKIVWSVPVSLAITEQNLNNQTSLVHVRTCVYYFEMLKILKLCQNAKCIYI